MKHATINSIVGVLGLLIATVTAISQFWPETDKLQIVVEGRFSTGRSVEFSGVGLLRPIDGEVSPTFGPVSWKLRLFNDTDRVISVIGYKVFQLSGDGSRIGSNSFKERLSLFEPSLSEQIFPFSVEAHEANAYILSLMVPFEKESDESQPCSKNSRTIRQFEQCFFTKGRDLFGNKVTASFDQSEPPSPITVEWSGSTYSPRFLIEFETASGATFGAKFSYYPF